MCWNCVAINFEILAVIYIYIYVTYVCEALMSEFVYMHISSCVLPASPAFGSIVPHTRWAAGRVGSDGWPLTAGDVPYPAHATGETWGGGADAGTD